MTAPIAPAGCERFAFSTEATLTIGTEHVHRNSGVAEEEDRAAFHAGVADHSRRAVRRRFRFRARARTGIRGVGAALARTAGDRGGGDLGPRLPRLLHPIHQ